MFDRKSYKICVVGLGNWGINHAKTLFRLGHLGGIVDNDSTELIIIQFLKIYHF